MSYNNDFAPQSADDEKSNVIELAGERGILMKEVIITPGGRGYGAPSAQTKVGLVWMPKGSTENITLAELYNDDVSLFLEFNCDDDPVCQDMLKILQQPELSTIKAGIIRSHFTEAFNTVAQQITDLFLDTLDDHEPNDVVPKMYALFVRGFEGDLHPIFESLNLLDQGDATNTRDQIEPIERGTWVKPSRRRQND